MNELKYLDRVFQSAKEILFDDYSKIVLMSDCHRGDGSWADNFSKNQLFYFRALNYYYNKNYIYIELGDGDELWENRDFNNILQMHKDAFWLLSKFYEEDRLFFIWGNHDIVKKDRDFLEKNLYQYFDSREKRYVPLFPNIKVHEGLVLTHTITRNKIFLVHGHQIDFLNYNLWRLARFLVRYLWRPLETFGIKDPASPGKNYKKRDKIDDKLAAWARKEGTMFIAGHTHRPMFPEGGECPYFNDGSGVHPRCITAIEIEAGYIKLVKWSMKTSEDGRAYIGRDILAGPRKLEEYYFTEEQENRI